MSLFHFAHASGTCCAHRTGISTSSSVECRCLILLTQFGDRPGMERWGPWRCPMFKSLLCSGGPDRRPPRMQTQGVGLEIGPVVSDCWRFGTQCRRLCNCKISQFQQDPAASIFQTDDFKRLARGRARGPEPDARPLSFKFPIRPLC